MILVIDNYDSFTWNLVDLIRQQSDKVEVCRNDELELGEIQQLAPKGILISPGPGRPENSGVSVAIVRSHKWSVLGICLGMQLIAQEAGANIIEGPEPVHGYSEEVAHQGLGVLKGIERPFRAMRYHSLVVDPESIPGDIEVTGKTNSGVIMAIRSKSYNFEGLQFHPESILSEFGNHIIRNWVREL